MREKCRNAFTSEGLLLKVILLSTFVVAFSFASFSVAAPSLIPNLSEVETEEAKTEPVEQDAGTVASDAEEPPHESAKHDEEGIASELTPWRIEENLRAARAQLELALSPANAELALVKEIVEARKESDEALRRDRNIFRSRTSFEELEWVHEQWSRRAVALDEWRGRIDPLIDTLAQALQSAWESLQQEESLRKRTDGETASPLLTQRMKEIRLQLLEAEGRADKAHEQLRHTQEHLLVLSANIGTANQELENSRNRAFSTIWQLDAPPVWGKEFWTSGGGVGVGSDSLRSIWIGAIVDYGRGHPEALTVHLLIFIAGLWMARTLRQRGRSSAVFTPEILRAAEIAEYPTLSALLLGTLAGLWIHSGAPRPVSVLLFAIALPPLLFFLPKLGIGGLRRSAAIVASIFLVTRLQVLFPISPMIQRLLDLAESSLALYGFYGFFRNKGSADDTTGYRLVRQLGRLAFILIAASVVLNIVGASALARLLLRANLSSAFLMVAFFVGYGVCSAIFEILAEHRPLADLRLIRLHRDLFRSKVFAVLKLVLVLSWGYQTLQGFESWSLVSGMARSLLTYRFGVGTISFAIGNLLASVMIFWLWLVATKAISFVARVEILPRSSLPQGLQYTIFTLTRYALTGLGAIVAVGAAGVSLEKLSFAVGALGVGVGLGLQDIVRNFVAGLQLLFERPVKAGDMIQVGELVGEVKEIGIRASVVRAQSGADVILPNATLISEQVINWTWSDQLRRCVVLIGVAYGTDPEAATKVLEDAVKGVSNVLRHPNPQVLFLNFGDSSLDFQVRFWTSKAHTYWTVQSEVTLAIHQALAKANIAIPFPQRDLYIKSVPSELVDVLKRPKSGD